MKTEARIIAGRSGYTRVCSWRGMNVGSGIFFVKFSDVRYGYILSRWIRVSVSLVSSSRPTGGALKTSALNLMDNRHDISYSYHLISRLAFMLLTEPAKGVFHVQQK